MTGRSVSRRIAYTVVIIVFVLFFIETEAVIEHVKKGMSLCARNVIPALFPFTVLSAVIVDLGFSDLVARSPLKLLGRVFGTGGAGATVPVMGALCGFPIGAMTAVRLFRRGDITKDEVSRLMLFSNNPSPAFLLGTIGSSFWSCRRFGALLYVLQLLSAMLIAALCTLFWGGKHGESIKKKDSTNVARVSDIFVRAISDSAISTLNICSLILFFAALVGVLGTVLDNFPSFRELKVLVYGFLEMSGAASEARGIGGETGMIITALICGWSGLSVHFQIFSICREVGIRKGAYLLAKAFQGVVSAFFMWLCLRLFPSGLPCRCISTVSSSADPQKISIAFAIFANAMLLIGVILFFLRRCDRTRL